MISIYRRGGLARKMDLTKAVAKFKKIIGDCKKAKVCPHCKTPAGKTKKMAGHPTKVLFCPHKYDGDYVVITWKTLKNKTRYFSKLDWRAV